MGRQRKHLRGAKNKGEGEERMTRSRSRMMKTESVSRSHTANAVPADPTLHQGATFMSTLVGHPELFFDRFVPFLATSSLMELCDALYTHHSARELLGNTQQWRYVAQRDEACGQRDGHAVTRSITVRGGCPELCDYLSLRSQLESFDATVVVIAGDLEFISEVEGVKVDCLVFPTSGAFMNPHIGVASCVHRRAGPELDHHVRTLSRNVQPPRRQLTTPGFHTGANLLIHCTGPSGADPNRKSLLYTSYVGALQEVERASDVHCAVFASISTGNLGYQVDEAAATAMAAVRDMMRSRQWPHDKKIAFACVDKSVLQAFTLARDQIRHTFSTSPVEFPDIVTASLV